jgi:sugar/nucleoside kinase (ribokinase family)
VKTVVVKHLDRTAVLTNECAPGHNRPSRCLVVDPVGAGDAFAAGLLSGILLSLRTERALEEAAWWRR